MNNRRAAPTCTEEKVLADNEFVAAVADRLAAPPNVLAFTLGGSRAQGTHGPDSDGDFALYYRGRFEPADLRAVGRAGEVFELGAWGGVFDGGAWPTIDGRSADRRARVTVRSRQDRESHVRQVPFPGVRRSPAAF